MNRLSSVIAGAITTAVSGATLAAAAVSQGVFDGSPSKSPHVGDAAMNAMAAQQTSWTPDAAMAEATPLAPIVVYVEREPVVVTREIRTVAQSAGNEAPSPAATSTPEPPRASTSRTNPVPAAAAQQPAGSPQQKSSAPAAPTMAVNAAGGATTTPPAATPASAGQARTPEAEHEREREREHEQENEREHE